METQSQEIGKLAEALSKAQAIMEGAKEDSANPFFKSKYADLSSVWAACKSPLTENGLSVIQTIDVKEDKTILVTTLAHSSGQWIKSFLPIILTKQDPQTQGSAITYARRFALAAIAGVTPEDDDGEGATRPAREDSLKQQKSSNILSEKDVKNLNGYLLKDEDAIPKILKRFNIKKIADIPATEFPMVIDWLEKRKEERENESRVA